MRLAGARSPMRLDSARDSAWVGCRTVRRPPAIMPPFPPRLPACFSHSLPVAVQAKTQASESSCWHMQSKRRQEHQAMGFTR